MYRQELTISLDARIIDALSKYADSHGWTLEELIRYILGSFCPPATVGTQDYQQAISQMAKLASSMQITKCPKCLNRLSSDDILAGVCSYCGEKF